MNRPAWHPAAASVPAAGNAARKTVRMIMGLPPSPGLPAKAAAQAFW